MAATLGGAGAAPWEPVRESGENQDEQATDAAGNPLGPGSQRLSLARLRAWEALGYGMFLHFGMSTFLDRDDTNGTAPPSSYHPDRLDVGQWVRIARDAGMKYVVLTAKHVAGHCLWPSRYTDYTVAHSGDKTDVVAALVKACAQTGVLPGLYYCSWDNHNLFGSFTISAGGRVTLPPRQAGPLAYTTSLYQDFQTAQVDELLTQYGPIAEMWIDVPGVLGRGYRTYLYEHMAGLQPQCVIMMNSNSGDGTNYTVDYAWPSDLMGLEAHLPPPSGHVKWREIEGKKYYIPGEVCWTMGKAWFSVPDDHPAPDDALLATFNETRSRGANLLLDVPPDRHGLIPDEFRDALMRLRKNAKL